MMRPRGSPPMPSAMSSPSEPVEMASISTTCSFLPSRMMEPLPNERSIWLSAASSAFFLSVSSLATRLTTFLDMSDFPLFHRRPSRAMRCSWKRMYLFCSHMQSIFQPIEYKGKFSLRSRGVPGDCFRIYPLETWEGRGHIKVIGERPHDQSNDPQDVQRPLPRR